MSNYIVEDRATGEVVHAYSADAPDHTDVYPFGTYNHILQSAVLDDYLRLLDTTIAQGGELDLDDADTIAAITMLEQVGLIAAGRSAEVLA